MVAVTTALTADASLTEQLNTLLQQYPEGEATIIEQACLTALPLYQNHTTLTGADLAEHALGTATILQAMRMDADTLAVAIMHSVPEYMENWQEKLASQFSPQIMQMLEGLARMEQIRAFSETLAHGLNPEQEKRDATAQIESLRKMFLAMVEDIRIVLIKLAERTQTMRDLARADEALQRTVAEETRNIFAPLANRLGVWQIKWEMEDLSLRFLEPKLYKSIAKLLQEKRLDREDYIQQVISQLGAELAKAGIRAEISGRPKHIHSIINKMKRKGVDFHQLYDVRAVRVLVDDVKDCYTALGIVHHMWQPVPGEFDDYISHPKSNNYQSLHTAVLGPGGKALEVQFRTHEMHQHAELGVAAHWRYEEGGKGNAAFEQKIAWLRQMLEWRDDVSLSSETGEDMIEQFRNELFQDQVYVLTPQGRVIDLPHGATPLDFAYHVHTDLGHRCRGAKVDGQIVPLNTPLANGQRVEIITAKNGAPSRDWLMPALGYLKSPRARAKVRHWFKHLHAEEHMAQGRVVLDKELQRLGLSNINLEKLAQRFNLNKVDELYAAIGRSELSHKQLLDALQPELPKQDILPQVKPRRLRKQQPGGVLIEGVGNLLSNLAKCCKPVPPDPIIGYITRGQGVTIHRQNCPTVLRMSPQQQQRLIAAHWGATESDKFAVDIQIDAYDRKGLLMDITNILSREKINVTRVNTVSEDNQAHMRFTLEVDDINQLSRILTLIGHLPNVLHAKRIRT